MNRRMLLKVLAYVLPVTVIQGVAVASVKKYGFMDVDGHSAHKKLTGENLIVYLDGQQVRDCYEADDVKGYVKVFCRDQQEHIHLNAKGAMHINGEYSGACRLMVNGEVVFRP